MPHKLRSQDAPLSGGAVPVLKKKKGGQKGGPRLTKRLVMMKSRIVRGKVEGVA